MRRAGLLLAGILVLLGGCGEEAQRRFRSVEAEQLLTHPREYHHSRVEVEGVLSSSFEHLGFGATRRQADGSTVWVEIDSQTVTIDTPAGFFRDPTRQLARVRIRGTFEAGPGPEGRGFGHMGAYHHRIRADRITFLGPVSPGERGSR